MELKFIFLFAVTMLGNLISNIISNEQAPPVRVREQTQLPMFMERQLVSNRPIMPSFVKNIPKEHFAGVSSPKHSIAEARKDAVGHVVRQILGSINAQYEHRYVDRVSGNVRSHSLVRIVDDKLSVVARGVVLGVEQNIVKKSWARDGFGRHIYFVLVHYPDELIDDMRRLSKGARVVASVISNSDNNIKLKVSEVNNVSVIISSANVTITKKNRFAKAISFFIWHVSDSSRHHVSVAIDPIKVCGGSSQVLLPLTGFKKDLKDYLLGAELDRVAVLQGHDELGRAVSTSVKF